MRVFSFLRFCRLILCCPHLTTLQLLKNSTANREIQKELGSIYPSDGLHQAIPLYAEGIRTAIQTDPRESDLFRCQRKRNRRRRSVRLSRA